MGLEIKVILLADPQLIVIIIQALLRNANQLSRFLKSPPLAISRAIMIGPPLLYKLDDLPDIPFPTPFLLILIFLLTAGLGAQIVEIRVVRILDHQHTEFQVLSGYCVRLHVQVIRVEGHVLVLLGAVDFEYLFVGLGDCLEQFLQVYRRSEDGDLPLDELRFVCGLILEKKCFFLHLIKVLICFNLIF